MNAETPSETNYVIDGDLLFHLLSWYRRSTYNQLVQSYMDYAIHMLNELFSMFKTESHQQKMSYLSRTKGGNSACDISFDSHMLLIKPK